MGGQIPARRGSARRVRRERERALAALATRQHGVLSRGQLLAAGLSPRTIERRCAAGGLHRLHRGVYALGHGRVSRRGEWKAAVLACGEGALLSHRSGAALWGLSPSPPVVEVSAPRGRRRPGLNVHEGGIEDADRTVRDGIPVTTVARTLFDLAEVEEEEQLRGSFEEADRLGLLQLSALEGVCQRGHGRRALRPIRRLIDEARMPETTRSPLESRFLDFCRANQLVLPQTNVTVAGREADAYWPAQRLVVELDGWSFHSHRAAFERDRARDAAMQAAGYRVIRITHRRLERQPAAIANELRCLLACPDGRAGD